MSNVEWFSGLSECEQRFIRRKGEELLANINGHDHDYFHDDCGMCQLEKAEFER